MTPKNVVLWMREISCFGTPFPSQRVHGTQTVLKAVSRVVYPNFPLMQDKLSQKTSLVTRWLQITCVLPTIKGLFGKTLKPHHLKNKTQFLKFLLHFWNLHKILHILEKKVHLFSLNSWEVVDSEKCGCLNAQKLLFQSTVWESECSWETNTA